MDSDLEKKSMTSYEKTEAAESVQTAEEVYRTPTQKVALHLKNFLLGRSNDSDMLEATGVKPLAMEQRTDDKYFNNFNLWLSMNATVSCFSTGTLGPFAYGLSARDSCLIIMFSNIFSCTFPAIVAMFGPGLGMRTMSIARYSYGYYGAMIPAILNLASFIGFCMVNSIAGGQVLAAVNPGHVSVTIGIVIISVIALVISICGYRVLHVVEQFAYIPVVLCFILLLGFGGRGLKYASDFDTPPGSAGAALSFISLIVGFTISWAGCGADFNTYMRPDVSKLKVFLLVFFGMYLPSAIIQIIGACFSAAALSAVKPTWETAFADGSIGNLLGVALEPLHWFGKVILVLFALGIVSNNAPTVYAFSLSAQIVLPFLTRFPRYILPIIATAIYMPLAIVGADSFDTAMQNFLGIIGYWASIFLTVLLAEHYVFRRGSFAAYDMEIWDSVGRLPTGAAAIFSSLVGAAMIVIGMDQVWWRGPVAKAIAPTAGFGGDLGFELAMVATFVSYVALRPLELKFFKR